MEWLQSLALVFTAIVLPFFISLLSQVDWDSSKKRVLAIIVSIIAGIAESVVFGVPTPETFVQWSFAVVGGVQMAYTAFKSIGVTSVMLDALSGVKLK